MNNLSKITNVVLFLFGISLSQGFSQNSSFLPIIPIDQSIQNSKVIIYPEGFELEQYKSFNDIKNDTPEVLLVSFFSASNKEWFDYNLKKIGSIPYNDFTLIKSQKFTIYPKLNLKFYANGVMNCMIKFEISNENKIASYALHMEKRNDRWHISNGTTCPYMHSFFVLISKEYIKNIIMAENTKSDFLNKLMKKHMEYGRINFNPFIKELLALKESNPIEFDQLADPYFKL